MSNTMTTVVERIADEPRFAERFRTDPETALRRYRLNSAQVEAVKCGDPASLYAHGVDVLAFSEGERRSRRRHWRRFLVAIGTVGAALSMTATPVAADKRFVRVTGIRRASARQIRAGRAITVRGVLLERSSVRKGLRRQGFNIRASGRTALRRALDLGCGKIGCELDVGDGEPILLAD